MTLRYINLLLTLTWWQNGASHVKALNQPQTLRFCLIFGYLFMFITGCCLACVHHYSWKLDARLDDTTAHHVVLQPANCMHCNTRRPVQSLMSLVHHLCGHPPALLPCTNPLRIDVQRFYARTGQAAQTTDPAMSIGLLQTFGCWLTVPHDLENACLSSCVLYVMHYVIILAALA